MELGFEARHVVTSSRGGRVLFGAFEHSVIVRDLRRCSDSARIETTFDFGGQRLALSDELGAVLTAAYDVHGVALYSCATGREVWRRKDLQKVQHITLARDGRAAYCGMEGSLVVVLDLYSGETTRTVPSAKSVHDSAFDAVQLVDCSRPRVVSDLGERRFFVERESFATLDVAFAPGLLTVSESAGPVRCIDILTGQERWRYVPPSDRHVLRLGYREAGPSMLGVEWPYENGGAMRLLRWSLHDGALIGSADLGEWNDCAFAMAGELLVTSDGVVIDCATEAPRRE